MFFEIFLFILLLIIIYIYYQNKTDNGKFPPGPKRLFFLGSLFELAKYKEKVPYILMEKLSKIHGSIMYLKLGMSSQVVVEDFETIKKILCSEIWTERLYDNYWAERANGKVLGILFISGENWKEMRRFALRTLRDFGFGKNKSMDEVMNDEIRDFFETINKNIAKNNGVIKMHKFFTVSVLNILWSMMAGEKFSHEDKRCQEFVRLMDMLMKSNPVGLNMYQIFPFLWYLIPKALSKPRTIRKQVTGAIYKFFSEIMTERRKNPIFLEEQRDFIDVFLKEIDNANKNPDLPISKFYTDEQFIVVCLDLFVAGSETTSNSLEFAILFSMLHQNVQKKVQKEIDNVVGRSRFPNSMDKPNMPYTEATLAEVQRMANVIPLIIRSPNQDTKLDNYDIPKETIGILNMYSVHMNKERWGDPLNFRPDRFLDADGNINNLISNILPFGLGKRLCLGEAMARSTLFTYYTAILQNYTIEKVPNEDDPSTIPILGLTQSPSPYQAIFKSR